MKKILSVLFLMGGLYPTVAQTSTGETSSIPKGRGHLFGVVIDSLSKTPVEFANVAIMDPKTGKPINGTVCDEKGKFSVTKVASGNISGGDIFYRL